MAERWRPVLFDCTRTGQKVQGLLTAEEVPGVGDTRYEPVSCLVHFVDFHGKILGSKNNE
jgi:hypothetical protein